MIAVFKASISTTNKNDKFYFILFLSRFLLAGSETCHLQ